MCTCFWRRGEKEEKEEHAENLTLAISLNYGEKKTKVKVGQDVKTKFDLRAEKSCDDQKCYKFYFRSSRSLVKNKM